MAEKEVKSPWEVYTGLDIGQLNQLNEDILEPRFNEGQSVRATLKSMVQDYYSYDIYRNQQGPLRAVVLKVLSGPQVNNEASTDGGNLTKTIDKLDVGMDDPVNKARKSSNKPPKIRVIAKVPEFDVDIDWPEDENDEMRIASHGEYHLDAESNVKKADQIIPGSVILVDPTRAKSSVTFDGGPSGKIVGVKEVGNFADVKKKKSAQKAHEIACRTTIKRSKRQGTLYVGTTDENPNERPGPPIRKLKGKIKTGMHGNGLPQTKAHFDSCMREAKESYKHRIKGAAPGSKNAFIWVGNLRNNGYMDLLHRVDSPGRETIIYAPVTLDLTSPIEIKYYFHDKNGFGNAFTGGTDTNVEQAEMQATTAGKNDFRDKIAPGIKDMIRDGRNFIIVIPEMSYSNGYLQRHKVYSEEQSSARSRLEDLSDDPGHNLLATNPLKNREFLTFDGSFSGGMFGLFHEEVLEVLEAHLGNVIRDRVEFISILADGMGGLNLASIVKNEPLSATHSEAENSFRDVQIKRIDYISDGYDDGSNTFYESKFGSEKKGPAVTIYEDYLKYWESTDSTRYIEFNYIGGPNDNRYFNALFNHVGQNDTYLKARERSTSGAPAERKFTFYTNDNSNSNNTVSYHLSVVEAAKAPYAMSMTNDFLPSFPGFPSKLDTLSERASYDAVPNHAFIAFNEAPSPSNNAKYKKIMETLEASNQEFENLLIYMNGLPNRICQPDADPRYKVYCSQYGGRVADVSSTSLFFSEFVKYVENKKKYYFYKNLLDHDNLIASPGPSAKDQIPIKNSRSKLQTYLEGVEKAIEDNAADVKQAREELMLETKEGFKAYITAADSSWFISDPDLGEPLMDYYCSLLGRDKADRAIIPGIKKAIRKAGPEQVKRPENCDPPPKKRSDYEAENTEKPFEIPTTSEGFEAFYADLNRYQLKDQPTPTLRRKRRGQDGRDKIWGKRHDAALEMLEKAKAEEKTKNVN